VRSAAKFKGEGDDKEPGDKAKGEGDEEAKKAQASLVAITARLHALETEKLEEREGKAKAALLDTRPDFSAEVRATLESLPMATVEQAVKNWKRAPGSRAAASMTMPTVIGRQQGEYDPPIDDDQKAAIDRAFGRRAAVALAGKVLTGTGDREAAKAYLDTLDKTRAQNSSANGGK
jgi:hypothetical protein